MNKYHHKMIVVISIGDIYLLDMYFLDYVILLYELQLNIL
jgi:hypothetical protein